MNKSQERVAAFAFGTLFVVVLLFLAIFHPNPTPFQYTVFRIVLALAAGGVAAMIPGFLSVSISNWLRGGGALAVFVIVYFFSPAKLTGVDENTQRELEIEKPIVLRSLQHRFWNVNLLVPAAHAEPRRTQHISLLVVHPDDLMKPEVLLKRYDRVVIKIRALVPSGATLIANDIYGQQGAALVGTDFSIVARTLSGVAVDVSANRGRGVTARAGSVWLYVKKVDNSTLSAHGADGELGAEGAPGIDGTNGADGRDGRCDGFGGYRGADDGQNGGNGGDGATGARGGDGGAGGSITLTTIVPPINTTVDVAGGAGGRGGAGGAPGAAGRGGRGGSGCVGLGGSQPTRANGSSGQPGKRGQDGPSGASGAAGDYRLVLVDSFDDIVAKLATLPNSRLHDSLRNQ